jgi:hypothetical protein
MQNSNILRFRSFVLSDRETENSQKFSSRRILSGIFSRIFSPKFDCREFCITTPDTYVGPKMFQDLFHYSVSELCHVVFFMLKHCLVSVCGFLNSLPYAMQ